MTKPVADRLRELEEDQRAINRTAYALCLDRGSEWISLSDELASIRAEVEAMSRDLRAKCSGEGCHCREINAARLAREKP